MDLKDELLHYFDSGLQQLKAELEAYPSDAALWQVTGAIANSGGNLCFHLVGNLNHYLGAALGNTGYMRDRPREFAIRDVPRQALMKYIEETRRMCWQVLRNLDDLDRSYPAGYFDEPGSVAFYLLQLLGHFQYHLGQINYHRRILGAG